MWLELNCYKKPAVVIIRHFCVMILTPFLEHFYESYENLMAQTAAATSINV